MAASSAGCSWWMCSSAPSKRFVRPGFPLPKPWLSFPNTQCVFIYPLIIFSLAWPGCLVAVSGFMITPLSHWVLLITLQFCDMEAALWKQSHVPVSSLSSIETLPGPRDLGLLFSSVLFLILSNLLIWDGASGAPPIKTFSMGNALSFSMINRCRKIISLLYSALIMLEHSFLLCLCCLLAVLTSSGRCPATAVSGKKKCYAFSKLFFKIFFNFPYDIFRSGLGKFRILSVFLIRSQLYNSVCQWLSCSC